MCKSKNHIQILLFQLDYLRGKLLVFQIHPTMVSHFGKLPRFLQFLPQVTPCLAPCDTWIGVHEVTFLSVSSPSLSLESMFSNSTYSITKSSLKVTFVSKRMTEVVFVIQIVDAKFLDSHLVIFYIFAANIQNLLNISEDLLFFCK